MFDSPAGGSVKRSGRSGSVTGSVAESFGRAFSANRSIGNVVGDSTLMASNFLMPLVSMRSTVGQNGGGASPHGSSTTMPFFRFLLKNAHPAHTQHILGACKVLATESTEMLFGDSWSALMRDCNETNCTAIALAESNDAGIICPEGRISATMYLHPKLGSIFSVNHEYQDGQIDRDSLAATLPSHLTRGHHSQFRLCLERAMDLHVKQQYPTSPFSSTACSTLDDSSIKSIVPVPGVACAVYGEEEISGLLTITVIIRSLCFNNTNAWAGHWLSRWKLSFTPGQAKDAVLKGNISADVQYHEDGNARLRQSREFSETLKAAALGDPRKCAASVVSVIADCELALHTSLERLFVIFDSQMLRAIRRIIPISCNRCSWDPLNDAIRTEVAQRTSTAADEARERAAVAAQKTG